MRYATRISARDLRRLRKALVLRSLLRRQKDDRRFPAQKEGGAK